MAGLRCCAIAQVRGMARCGPEVRDSSQYRKYAAEPGGRQQFNRQRLMGSRSFCQNDKGSLIHPTVKNNRAAL